MKKHVEVLVFWLAVLFILLGMLNYLIVLFNHTLLLPGMRSILISLLFGGVVLLTNTSWKRSGVIVVLLFALVAMFVDVAGNGFYNLFLEWIFNNGNGHFEILRNSSNMTYQFLVVNQSGSIIETIPIFWIFLFRFMQYVLIHSLLLTVINGGRKYFKGVKRNQHVKENVHIY